MSAAKGPPRPRLRRGEQLIIDSPLLGLARQLTNGAGFGDQDAVGRLEPPAVQSSPFKGLDFPGRTSGFAGLSAPTNGGVKRKRRRKAFGPFGMNRRTMTKPSDKTRLSRYRADRTAFPDFQPSERHQRILLLVHAHRFLDTELLWHLLRVLESETPAHGVKSGFGREALYKALQKMFNAGYLNRHFLYDVPIGRGKGTPPTVYGLGTKSARLLSELLGCSPRYIQDIVEANKVKTPFLRHALEIARFRVTLELACMASGGEKKLLFWEQGQQLKETVTALDMRGNERQFSVYPDAMFALELEGKGRACYFLEIDRGTMPIRAATERPDLVGKFIGYRKFREKKMMERKYGYRLVADGTVAGLAINERPFHESELIHGVKPIPGFNVLFVMPGSIDAEGKPTGRIRNCLAELVSLGAAYSTSSLFWFTSPESYTVEEPNSILKNIWITSNAGQGLQSLVE